MIDFHSHILPGIDDGADDIEESVAMATALRDAGYKTIYCTPHLIKGCFDADKQAVLSAVSILRDRLKKENIQIEVRPGREYYLDEFLAGYLKDPLPLGETKHIMLEIPNNTPAEYIKEACFKIKLSGFIPMIAHPERYGIFAPLPKSAASGIFSFGTKRKTSGARENKNELLNYLRDIGCAFQGNLGSFIGIYGPDVQQTANYLKEQAVYTHFGTDAHSIRGVTILNLKPNPPHQTR